MNMSIAMLFLCSLDHHSCCIDNYFWLYLVYGAYFLPFVTDRICVLHLLFDSNRDSRNFPIFHNRTRMYENRHVLQGPAIESNQLFQMVFSSISEPCELIYISTLYSNRQQGIYLCPVTLLRRNQSVGAANFLV